MAEPEVRGLRLTMQDTATRAVFPGKLGKRAPAVLLLAGVALLAGCQGTSVGGSNPPPSGTLSLAKSMLDFGNVTVGSNKTMSATVTNSGSALVDISSASVTSSAFSLSGASFPLTVAPGQSVTLSVKFSPKSAASASGSITLASDASNSSLSIELSGAGVASLGQLTVSPSTMDLGSVVVGSSGTATGTLTASGASVMVTAASTNNSSVFAVSGLSLPVTIAAGKSISFTITFSPKTAGAATATLTLTSDASNSSATESLKGIGTAAATHSVNLSWDASSSPNISGYNVYRAAYSGSCGSFSKINALLDTGTLYTDTIVTGGASYCYGVRAVNTSGDESSFSNLVKNVKIPSP